MTTATRVERIDFLFYAICEVAKAAGMSQLHAEYIADALVFAHRQGKLNQGLGVYEAIDIAIAAGAMDVEAEPEIIGEGPAFVVVDGHRSSGYYTLNMMADAAIAKARDTGIAIAFGGNHNDAGSFAGYVYKAYQQGMAGMASNNTVPLAAPFGGMENMLGCPPFDAIFPSDEEPPIWTSIKLAEWYDADISEAVLNNQPMKGRWLIDPETGELSDNPQPYAKPIPGYGRVWDATCAGQIESPRTYALNLWNEGMTSIINPLGTPVSEMPSIDDFANGDAAPSVGGSYFMAIDPAVFGSLAGAQARSDAFISKVKNVKPRPGQRVRIPGESAYQSLASDAKEVEIIECHWQPFFETIAGRYGLSEVGLREAFRQEAGNQ